MTLLYWTLRTRFTITDDFVLLDPEDSSLYGWVIFPTVDMCTVCPYHVEAETRWPTFFRRHFQMHFFNENVWILIKISLKFVPKGPINNIPTSVQVRAAPNRRQAIIWTNDDLIYWHIYASLGFEELLYKIFSTVNICAVYPYYIRWIVLFILIIQGKIFILD